MAKIISLVVILAVTMVMIAFAPSQTNAVISCDQVGNSLNPCIGYVLYGAGPTSQCCDGANSLFNQARTTLDRRALCSCIKGSIAKVSVAPAVIRNAASLPRKCGISINFAISPSTNCNRIV